MVRNRLKLLGAAAVLATAIAAGACTVLENGGGDSESAPSATAEPTAAATPTWTPYPVGTATPRVEPGAADEEALQSANLVVYADEFSDELWAAGIHEIVAYDLDAGRPAASFRVSYPTSMNLVGRDVLIQDSKTVTISDLGGESQRVVFVAPGDRTITGAAATNDGELVAIGTEGADTFPDERSELLVVELATGVVTRTFTFDDLGVTPYPLAWRADGSAIEFREWLHKGVIDMAPTGTARLDGTVEHHEGSLVEIGDGGRVGAWSTGNVISACDGVNAARDSFVLRDMLSRGELGELTIPGQVLTYGLWSPEGQEFLVAAYAVDAEAPNGQPCWEAASPAYYLWNDSGVEPVADRHGVLREWEGERYIEVECDSSVLPRWTGNPLPQVTCDQNQVRQRATLRIGGESIDTVRDGTILGFIDAP